MKRLTFVVCLWSLLAGCGLFGESVGWRSYPLREIGVEEGSRLVRDVVRLFITERFGGAEIMWDPQARNLRVADIDDGEQVLSLRLHLEPQDDGLSVEMLALVRQLAPGSPGDLWGEPRQDVHLEEMLYDAILAEYLERKVGA